jgi:Domain of unknown function (DUF4384)
MSLTRVILAALCAVSTIPAQQAPRQLTARELFYAAAQVPPKPAAKPPARPVARPERPASKPVEIARADPAPKPSAQIIRTSAKTAPMPSTGEPPLGLRYTLLKVNPDGSTLEVPTDTVFHSGDRIRFSIEPNASGYLYIINQGSSGTWKPMFPSPEIEDGNNQVTGFHPHTLPASPKVLTFDTTAGTENLFIVLSRQPEPDLEQMIYSLRGKSTPKAAATPEEPAPASDKTLIMAANIGNPMVDRLRGAYSRDLIVETVTAKTPGTRKETAVYVVNPSGSDDSRVVADLHLVHQ